MKTIALTCLYKNRLDKLNENGIKKRNFNPDSIDITKTFISFQKDNKMIFDEVQGFMRLIENPSFLNKQKNWLKNKIQENKNLNHRFLIRFPEKFTDFNKLRNIFIDIQEKAGMKKIFLFFSVSENYGSIKEYLKNLDKSKDYVLVLDMAMEFEVLKPLLENNIGNSDELVLLYREWTDYKDNFSFVIRQAQKSPEILHMAFTPLDLNIYGNKDIFATALICNGFKSVSFIDTEFKKFFVKWKNPRRVKTHKQKVDETRWVNEEMMSYDKKHNQNCLCFGTENNAEKVMRDYGIKEAVTYHNLEVLSKTYTKAKQNQKFKEELLNLENIKPILVSLKLQ